MTEDLDIGIQLLPSGDIAQCGQLPKVAKSSLYKTELCKRFMENGTCRYGSKCQFAHGEQELRGILRHPKYKTVRCKNYSTTGICPYGSRCRFLHEESGHKLAAAKSMEEIMQAKEAKPSYGDSVNSSASAYSQEESTAPARLDDSSEEKHPELHPRSAVMGFTASNGQTSIFVPQYLAAGVPVALAPGAQQLSAKPTATIDVSQVDWSMPTRPLTVQPEVEPSPAQNPATGAVFVGGNGSANYHAHGYSAAVPEARAAADGTYPESAENQATPATSSGAALNPQYNVLVNENWNAVVFDAGATMLPVRSWSSDNPIPVSGYMVPSPYGMGLTMPAMNGFTAANLHEGAQISTAFEQYAYYGMPQPVQEESQPPRDQAIEETMNGLSAMSLSRSERELKQSNGSDYSDQDVLPTRSSKGPGQMEMLNAHSDPVLMFGFTDAPGDRSAKTSNPKPIGQKKRGSNAGQGSMFVTPSDDSNSQYAPLSL